MSSPLDHPARAALTAELHARAAPRVQAPARIVRLVLKEPANAAHRDRAQDVCQLAHLLDAASPIPASPLPSLPGVPDVPASPGAAPADDAQQHDFTRVGYQVTWESHTEFAAYTAVSAIDQGEPFTADPDDLFPSAWQTQGTAARIAAIIVEVLPMPGDARDCIAALTQWLDPPTTIAMTVLDGLGVAASDFRADADGFTRFVLFVRPEAGPGRVGRTVQRLLDLETYRVMAMLALPRVHDLTTKLNAADARLLELVEHLEHSDRPTVDVLHDLLAVTGELEALATVHDFRFGATTAYAAIVEDRLTGLGDQRFRNRQTFREFFARRYQPAIRTITSADARLTRLLQRAGRAGDLLRTSVDVDRSTQNQALLKSMDARAETQLQLQHTVEGLSVVAITYYALGLLAYLLAPLAERAGIEKVWLMAALTPLVLLGAWLGLRLARRRIHRHPQ